MRIDLLSCFESWQIRLGSEPPNLYFMHDSDSGVWRYVNLPSPLQGKLWDSTLHRTWLFCTQPLLTDASHPFF